MIPNLTLRRRARTRGVVAGALLFAACIGLGALARPVFAHHAFAAEYDGEKPIDLTGVVTKVRWINPHSWLSFDVTGADGTVTNWTMEFGAPNALADAGLQRVDVAKGTKVRIQGFRSKNGTPTGYSVNLILGDGRTIKVGGAQDVPAAAPGKSGDTHPAGAH